jgi:GT2 family glycosyltransferase
MNSSNMSVSIIIPNYNGQKLLAQYLPKVIKAAKGCEVIVVDDASPQDDVAYIRKNFPQVKVVPLKTNQRFAAACNAGVAKAEGDIIILLNSDVEPTEDFIKPLVQLFADPNVFAVGCAEINPLEDKTKIYGRAGEHFEGVSLFTGEQQTKPNLLLSGFRGGVERLENLFGKISVAWTLSFIRPMKKIGIFVIGP